MDRDKIVNEIIHDLLRPTTPDDYAEKFNSAKKFEKIMKLIRRCWAHDSFDRPKMEDVISTIESAKNDETLRLKEEKKKHKSMPVSSSSTLFASENKTTITPGAQTMPNSSISTKNLSSSSNTLFSGANAISATANQYTAQNTPKSTPASNLSSSGNKPHLMRLPPQNSAQPPVKSMTN
jgi:hypothetical protein